MSCICKKPIVTEGIKLIGRINEEGEPFTILEFTCPSCGYFIKATEWGEVDIDDALGSLMEEIKEDYIQDGITDDTTIEGITCSNCGEMIPPHTVKQHFDVEFMEEFHNCPEE